MATQTPQASFFVSCPRASISGGQTRDVSMVALAGLPQGRPVSIEAGSSNPVNVTAPVEIGTSGGDSSNSMEAVTMATTLTQTPLFVWRFVSGQNSTCFTTTAASEREARLQLPAVRLVFAARIRVEEVHHA
ncbi:host cell division inhibitor Icd-like protein [Salmonella enterica]|nr:host cell division inhibitor Icd-like protein [Salmonella enterica]